MTLRHQLSLVLPLSDVVLYAYYTTTFEEETCSKITATLRF
jgi:hypothetical protein